MLLFPVFKEHQSNSRTYLSLMIQSYPLKTKSTSFPISASKLSQDRKLALLAKQDQAKAQLCDFSTGSTTLNKDKSLSMVKI
jgi:hypothetical protein